jgi:hypothetical protein
MLEFIRFWFECFCSGWETAHGVVDVIGSVAGLVSAVFLFRKRSEKHRKEWEDFVMKTAFCVFIGAFLISTIFVAPFVQFRESNTKTKQAEEALNIQPGYDIRQLTAAYKRPVATRSDLTNNLIEGKIVFVSLIPPDHVEVAPI